PQLGQIDPRAVVSRLNPPPGGEPLTRAPEQRCMPLRRAGLPRRLQRALDGVEAARARVEVGGRGARPFRLIELAALDQVERRRRDRGAEFVPGAAHALIACIERLQRALEVGVRALSLSGVIRSPRSRRAAARISRLSSSDGGCSMALPLPAASSLGAAAVAAAGSEALGSAAATARSP